MWAKYVARVSISEWLINTNNGQLQNYLQCDHRDTGCGYASATCSWSTACGPATINALRNASTNSVTFPSPVPANCWSVSFGDAFQPPPEMVGSSSASRRSSAPIYETVGSATCNISTNSGVDSLTGSAHIDSISGTLSATNTSRYGVVYRAVVWRSAFDGDTVMTPQKVLWDSSVRIEHGQVVTTGDFSLSDFLIDNVAWADGTTHVRVRPVPGLSKAIPLALDNTDNHVQLVEYLDQGYGAYNPQYVFAEVPTLPAYSVPFVRPFALLAAAGLLVIAWLTRVRRTSEPA